MKMAAFCKHCGSKLVLLSRTQPRAHLQSVWQRDLLSDRGCQTPKRYSGGAGLQFQRVYSAAVHQADSPVAVGSEPPPFKVPRSSSACASVCPKREDLRIALKSLSSPGLPELEGHSGEHRGGEGQRGQPEEQRRPRPDCSSLRRMERPAGQGRRASLRAQRKCKGHEGVHMPCPNAIWAISMSICSVFCSSADHR